MYSVVFFFALFCSHTFMYYTIFFLSNRTFDIVSVRTVKRVLSFSLSVNVYCWNWTHTASRWEKHPKKRQWKIYKTQLRNKNSPKRISRWYTHSGKQDYIQTEWIECTNEWKKCNPSFCICRFESQFYNKLHSFLCSSLILLLCQNHQRNSV